MIALMLAAQVPFETVIAKPPTELSEAYFKASDAEELPAKLASACMDHRWPVIEQSATQVKCEGETESWRSFLGPRYADYKGTISFNIVKLGNKLRVQGAAQTTQSNAFGQTKTFSASGSDAIQTLLIQAGGQYPEGTTFKGIDLGAVGVIDDSGRRNAFVIKSLASGGAGAVAGLQIGDKIMKVGRGATYTLEDFRRMVGKFKEGEAIPLEVVRDGQSITVNVIARIRPPAASPRF